MTERPAPSASLGPWTAGVGAAAVAASLTAPAPAAAQLLLTQEEALELAFPGASVERRTAFLSEEQVAAIRNHAPGTDMTQRVVTYYVGSSGGRATGVAYFDAHRVRTLPEVLMVVIGTDERVRRTEVLRFSEPPQYLAPPGWLEQLDGRGLGDGLSLKDGIVNMTGATLTASAVTEAVRRVLAIHRVLAPLAAAGGEAESGTP